MDDAVADTLNRLAERLGDLPEEVQADLLAEFEAKIEDFAASQMTGAQRSVIAARLTVPREYATTEQVTELLRRFSLNP